MNFIDSTTELTTAATDVVLAIECFLILIILWRKPRVDIFRRSIWSWVMGLLGSASFFAAAAHGLDLSLTVREILWKPIYLILGILVAMFLIGAIHDWLGRNIARRCVPWGIGLGVVLFIFTEIFDGLFIVFVVYEAVIMLAALLIYGFLAWCRKQPGAGTIAVAILINLIAAGVQTSSISVTCIWEFDHNGVFHLIQIVAIGLLGIGVTHLQTTK